MPANAEVSASRNFPAPPELLSVDATPFDQVHYKETLRLAKRPFARCSLGSGR